jgi:hypothetical protein
MKLNKLIGLLVLGFGVLVVTDSHAAAAPARGAKNIASVNYTTTASTVAANGAAVVYGLILSTGTAGTDFTALFDAATAASIAAGNNTNMKARVNVSSATQNTIVVFDPPLQFNTGVIVANSSAANWALVIYEKGRIPNGY